MIKPRGAWRQIRVQQRINRECSVCGVKIYREKVFTEIVPLGADANSIMQRLEMQAWSWRNKTKTHVKCENK